MDTVRNGEFGLTNTNKLVRYYEGATGLKTGFTNRSMYCLSATAERDGMELIAVIMHGETSAQRFEDAKMCIRDRVARYVTDFPNNKTAGVPGIVAIPHLGASTPESEDNCAVMAANEIIDYLENGNIVNSVNMPAAHLPVTGDPRICIFHQNVPDMIAKITSLISSNGINIENMVNASKKGAKYAYTLLDVLQVPDGIEDALKAIEGVMRVRTIK